MEKVHCSTVTSAGWSDAAFGNPTKVGRCRLGYVIWLVSSSSRDACDLSQGSSKFTRKLVKGGLRREVYTCSEMMDHVVLLK